MFKNQRKTKLWHYLVKKYLISSQWVRYQNRAITCFGSPVIFQLFSSDWGCSEWPASFLCYNLPTTLHEDSLATTSVFSLASSCTSTTACTSSISPLGMHAWISEPVPSDDHGNLEILSEFIISTRLCIISGRPASFWLQLGPFL